MPSKQSVRTFVSRREIGPETACGFTVLEVASFDRCCSCEGGPMSCVALCRHNSGKSLYRNVSKCAGLHHRRMYSQADASNVMCSALQSSGIALSDIQKTILTNREYFYPRVPSCTALCTTECKSETREARVRHGVSDCMRRNSNVAIYLLHPNRK